MDIRQYFMVGVINLAFLTFGSVMGHEWYIPRVQSQPAPSVRRNASSYFKRALFFRFAVVMSEIADVAGMSFCVADSSAFAAKSFNVMPWRAAQAFALRTNSSGKF